MNETVSWDRRETQNRNQKTNENCYKSTEKKIWRCFGMILVWLLYDFLSFFDLIFLLQRESQLDIISYMLLIPDIHITTRYQTQILRQLDEYVMSSDDKTVILMGDYVYHFSYQRSALMALFSLFVSRYKQWKDVVVLAWNHDWLSHHFVYHEGQAAFAALHHIQEKTHDNNLSFVTQPQQMTKDGQSIFFLPYQLEPVMPEITPAMREIFPELVMVIEECLTQWEKHSAIINAQALAWLATHHEHQSGSETNEVLTIIHHYYVANTVFPWQKTRFHLKDHALSELWLERDDVGLISGHIHRPFSYKNYLCVWSMRYTSPWEINHIKYFFQWKASSYTATPVMINPYIQYDLSPWSKVEKETLTVLCEQISDESKKTMTDHSARDISVLSHNWKYEDVALRVRGDIQYDDISVHVADNVVADIKDLKLRKTHATVSDLLGKLHEEKSSFAWGRQDRKNILKAYIEKKYPEIWDDYTSLLKKLDIQI